MRRSLSLFVLLVLTAAVAARAQSTFLSFNSQPGDWVGQGQQLTLTPTDGTVNANGSVDGVGVTFGGSGQSWSLSFYPPAGVALQPGIYEEATRYPFQSPTHPGLSVTGNGRGCNTVTGRFVVLEAVYGTGNTVQKLAVDYEQHCEGGAPALYGSVRINSTVTAAPRLSVSSAKVYEGDAGNTQMSFVISLSAPAASPVSVDYATADDTASAGSDYVAASGTANFPAGVTAVPVTVSVIGDGTQEADETFTLSLQNASGAPVAFGQGVGTILNDDPLKTLLYFKSQTGDFVGQGQEFTLTSVDGAISASGSSTGVTAGFSGGTTWDLSFIPPTGVALQPGIYEGAARWPFQSPTHPGLDVSGNGRGCSKLTGRFEVLEVVYGTGNTVQQLAVDYEQHCEGAAAALYGSVRINSAVPVGPRLSVGSVKVYEGDTGITQMSFVISLSIPATGPVSVGYATTNGTATAGSDYLAVSGTANFPAGVTAVPVTVSVIGDRTHEADETFNLSLQNPAGAPVAYGQAVGTILDDDPLKTAFYFSSQPGDYIGGGRRFTLTPVDGTFSAVGSTSVVSLSFSGEDSWGVDFAAAGNAPLTVGVYRGAVRYPFQPTNSNGMDVSGAGRGCNNLTGQFVILEAVYGTGNQVQRFAADYEQHCEGGAAALFGSVRYNSSIPLPPPPTDFYTLTPCRLLDTRQTGPGVLANSVYTFPVAGHCGVPATAGAVALNITVVSPTAVGDLRLFPAGAPAPLAAVLAFTPGRILASNATGTLGDGGSLSIQNDMPAGSSGSTHVVVDVVGYFQ